MNIGYKTIYLSVFCFIDPAYDVVAGDNSSKA